MICIFPVCICCKDYFSVYMAHMSHRMTKPTKWHVCPAKTQISLGIRPVRSESLLSAWRNLGYLATHWVHSNDWSDWVDAQADLSLCWAHMPFCWFCHVLARARLYFQPIYLYFIILYTNCVVGIYCFNVFRPYVCLFVHYVLVAEQGNGI